MQVKAPNPKYTGHVHGVAFIDGAGATWDPTAISYFARKGYSLAEDEFDTDATRKAASGKNPLSRRRGRASEDAAESAAMTQAQRQDAYGIGVGTLLPQGHSVTGAPSIDAGLPQLSYGQRQKLRDYLDERDQQDPNAQGPTAVIEGSADKAVKAAGKKTTSRKSTRKSTAKTTRKSTSSKSSK